MQKSAKLTAVYALIMDLPLSLVITLVALALSNIDAPGSLNGPNYIRMACLAYVVTFFVNFIHAERWGFAFAAKHSKPGTLKFGILLNVVVAAVFCVILDLIMTAVGMIAGGAFSFGPYIAACLKDNITECNSVEELAKKLFDEYDVTEEQALADTKEFVYKLVELDIIEF